MKSYTFLKVGGKDNGYIFETKREVFYEVKFKNSDYIFQDITDDFQGLVFEFVVEILYNPHSPLLPADQYIGSTIAEIFNHFYKSNNDIICVYICDSSDNKQDLRMKKFNQWFYKYQDTSFIKFDEILTDSLNNRFPISLILKSDNSQKYKIIETFLTIKNWGK